MERFGLMYKDVLGWPYFMDRPVGDVDTVYIIGMYDAPDYDWTLENTKRAKRRVIHWCGSDAMSLTRPEMLPEAIHLADSQMVRDILLVKHGIDAKVVQAPTALHPPMTPLPKEPTISVYFGGIAENYGASYVRYLMDCLPEVRWATYQYGQFDDAQMLGLIANSTMTLRLTSHDGSASGTREYLEAGRRVVSFQPIPFAKQVSQEDPVGLLAAVRSALKHTEPHAEAHEFYKEFNSAERFIREFKGATNGE
jgi:hypothetical protein